VYSCTMIARCKSCFPQSSSSLNSRTPGSSSIQVTTCMMEDSKRECADRHRVVVHGAHMLPERLGAGAAGGVHASTYVATPPIDDLGEVQERGLVLAMERRSRSRHVRVGCDSRPLLTHREGRREGHMYRWKEADRQAGRAVGRACEVTSRLSSRMDEREIRKFGW